MSLYRRIAPAMMVLEIVDRFRHTEAVFKKYDDQAGACLYCQALFETLLEPTKRYGLVLENLLDDLEELANEVPRPKGGGFPVWYFPHYIVPVDPALKGGAYEALAGQEMVNPWVHSFREAFSMTNLRRCLTKRSIQTILATEVRDDLPR